MSTSANKLTTQLVFVQNWKVHQEHSVIKKIQTKELKNSLDWPKEKKVGANFTGKY